MAMPCGPTLSVVHPGCSGAVVVVVVRGTVEVVGAMMEGNAELPGECRDPPPVASWLPDEQPASKAATPVMTQRARRRRTRCFRTSSPAAITKIGTNRTSSDRARASSAHAQPNHAALASDGWFHSR